MLQIWVCTTAWKPVSSSSVRQDTLFTPVIIVSNTPRTRGNVALQSWQVVIVTQDAEVECRLTYLCLISCLIEFVLVVYPLCKTTDRNIYPLLLYC